MKTMSAVRTFDYSKFSFSNEDNTFIAEASDFSTFGDLFHSLYSDACDVGFNIRGKNEVKSFYFQDAHEQDGEIIYWKFLPVDEKLRERDVKVIVFND